MELITKINNKLDETGKLAKKALIDKPICRPSKGFKYIKDVSVGELVDTNSGLRAIVIDSNEVSTSVLVIKADNHPQKDRDFYLGKHRWGNETEVKIIGD
tara:strand:+ start:251 stop:550 length:300 start_codon:yes stop_codon:yes gene_type:complete